LISDVVIYSDPDISLISHYEFDACGENMVETSASIVELVPACIKTDPYQASMVICSPKHVRVARNG